MDPTLPQTSFIPKKPLSEDRPVRSRPVNMFVFIATLIFFASIVAAVGVYLYRSVISKQVTEMNAELERARASFDPALLGDLQTLDRRISAANQLLAEHRVLTPIFEALQTLTLKTIRYTKFSYKIADPTKKIYQMDIDGQSSGGYAPIALQSDMFLRNKYIIDPIFSNLAVDDRGRVTFKLSFTVDSALISYENSLASMPPVPSSNTAGTTTIPTGGSSNQTPQ